VDLDSIRGTPRKSRSGKLPDRNASNGEVFLNEFRSKQQSPARKLNFLISTGVRVSWHAGAEIGPILFAQPFRCLASIFLQFDLQQYHWRFRSVLKDSKNRIASFPAHDIFLQTVIGLAPD
jgi:hypothetical protein